MEPMDVRNSRILAIACIVVGALLLIVSLLAQTGIIGVAAGAVLALLGILLMVNPMVRITGTEVQVRSPIGIVNKRFPVSAPSDLTMDGNTLRHTGQDKKVASLGFAADKEDVAKLRSTITGGPAQ